MGIFSRAKQSARKTPTISADTAKKQKVSLKNSIEFEHVMSFYRTSIAQLHSTEERNAIRRYLLSLIKREWEFSAITNVLYYPEQAEGGHHISFPLASDPCSPTQWKCTTIPQNKTISLSDDITLTFPWDLQRCFRTALILGKEPFLQNNSNHHRIYFRHMQFCFVCNGFHSTAAGIAFRNGTLTVDEIDDEPLLKYIETDGKYWYDSTSSRSIQEVGDYHEALVFQLTKEEYLDNLQNK